jgi:hypothetical protein
VGGGQPAQELRHPQQDTVGEIGRFGHGALLDPDLRQ